jgi:hypothetical protein
LPDAGQYNISLLWSLMGVTCYDRNRSITVHSHGQCLAVEMGIA